MKNKCIEHSQVKQTLLAYDGLHDANAWVAVTAWSNGEGWDIELNEKNTHASFQMTWDQWEALKKAMKAHLKGN